MNNGYFLSHLFQLSNRPGYRREFRGNREKMKAKMGNTGDVKVEITELDAPAVIPQNLLERV